MPDPVLETMSAHRSVRSFLARPVPDADIEDAVRAARMAATSSWIHGYSLLQVTDPRERAELARLTGGQPQVAEAGAFFAVLGDTRRHRLVAARAEAPYANNLEVFLLAVIDASLFAQNLTLAFEAQGYGTCYIGGLRNDLAAVDALLELPHGVYPLFGLCVGVPTALPDQRPRLAPGALWCKDRYPTDAEVLAAVDDFDEEAAAHYAARGLAGRNWSGATWRKFRAPLREALRGYYESKGAAFE